MGNWNNNKIEELKRFYQENDVPSDQLVKDKAALDTFTSSLNIRIKSDENFTSKEVADQLLKLRKSGKLPRLRR